MAQLVNPLSFSLARDAEGHREYKLKFLVALAPGEGVLSALICPGLPLVGAPWVFGIETDPWATCQPTALVTPHEQKDNDPVQYCTVEQTFSTKPPEQSKNRCQDTSVEDPLQEPQKISGSFTRYQEEATLDRYNRPIKTSSHEIIRGKHVEFDSNRPTVTIEQNVASLELPLWGPMIDRLNDAPLWGFPARAWKLSTANWERKFWQKCAQYFTRKFTFELGPTVRHDNPTGPPTYYRTWDRDLLDEGSKVLNGKWDADKRWVLLPINGAPPNPQNPQHFIKATDPQGQPMRMVLNGSGLPAGTETSSATPPVTICAVRAIADDILLTIAAQPTQPAYLEVRIVDPDNSIVQGNVRIIGTDANDFGDYEDIDISDSGSLNYITTKRWKTVGSITVGGPVGPVIGETAGDTISVVTSITVTGEGKIHVEKYEQANFFLLNIPVDLEAGV